MLPAAPPRYRGAMTSRVAVVTDSSAALPPQLAARWGITVVPLQVIVDGDAHAEGVDVDASAVLAALVGDQHVSTSQPSRETFRQAFAALEADGAEAIVAVLLSSGLSGTTQAAMTAADAVAVPVDVVDSRQVAMGLGFAAIAAAAAAARGACAADVAAEARRVAASARCIFTVDTLEFLRRGGRLSSASAAVGRMLQVRPVLDIVDGRVEVVQKVRSTTRAREAVTALASAVTYDGDGPVYAVHTVGDGAYGDAAAAALGGAVVRADIGAVLAVHAGPGALAIVTADLPSDLVSSPA